MSSRGSKSPSSSTLSCSRTARCTPPGGSMNGTKASCRGCRPRCATGDHLLCKRWQPGHLSVFAAKKLKLKRTASSSNGRQNFCKKRVQEVSSIFSDGCEAVVKNPSQELCWHDLSQELAAKLSPSIVSLASFDGDKMHYKSTGIVVRNNTLSGASVLTLSALVNTSDTDKWSMPELEIKLRLPNKGVVDGWIQHYNLPFNMVVITTEFSPDLREACLSKDSLQVDSHTLLLAVKRCYDSGKLMKTYGKQSCQSEVDSEGFMFCSCNITMDGSGGPLVDCEGNIVGMNDYHGQEITRCVPTNKILECLSGLWLSVEELQNISIDCKHVLEELTKEDTPEFTEVKPTPTLTKDENLSILAPWPSDDFTKEVNDILISDGYPLPAYADDGMYLKGTFEEKFGTHMRKHTRRVSLMKSNSVVALASFNDKGRHFACSGVFLYYNESTSASLVRTSGDENKIVDNLRIEACLQKEKPVIGTLLCYDFRYNVALVSIPVFSDNHAAISVEATQTKVVALGRAFKSGSLMATDGLVIGEQDNFDCRELKSPPVKSPSCTTNIIFSCAGIGGPLYDLNGNFVGMNFYDTEGTPYLPRNIIIKLLESFGAEWAVAAGITEKSNYRAVADGITEKPNYSWLVPNSYWYYPSHNKQNIEPEMILE